MENSRGIQQLMEAEHSATKIVSEMREGPFPPQTSFIICFFLSF
jgi:hypothetical protein